MPRVVAIGFPLDIVGESKVFDNLLVGTVQRSQAQSVFSHPYPMLKAMQPFPMQRVIRLEEVKQVLGDEGAEVHEVIVAGYQFKVDSTKLTCTKLTGEGRAEGEKAKG